MNLVPQFSAAQIAAALAAPRTRLVDCPPAQPFAPHARLFRAAVTHAVRLGLPLPAAGVEVSWTHGGAQAFHRGETLLYSDGRIVVVMNADLRWPSDVVAVALHELQHVADYSDPALRGLDPVELERRAMAFAARALAAWR